MTKLLLNEWIICHINNMIGRAVEIKQVLPRREIMYNIWDFWNQLSKGSWWMNIPPTGREDGKK